MEIQIVYRDENLVVAVKKPGIPSIGDMRGDPSMVDLLQEQLGTPVHPISRLDRAVGGLMLFALNPKTAAELSKLTDETYQKEYYAICEGVSESKNGMMEDYLFHDKRKNMTSVVSKDTKKAKYAKLSYEILETVDGFSLVKVRLHTGRTHQIRVQFASRNMPLMGDGKYGSRERCPIALFASQVSFLHPVNGETVVCKAAPESTEPWTNFTYFQNQNGGNIL